MSCFCTISQCLVSTKGQCLVSTQAQCLGFTKARKLLSLQKHNVLVLQKVIYFLATKDSESIPSNILSYDQGF